MKEKTRAISTRVSQELFAKALDGLKAKGISEQNLSSNSNIIKTALLMCCLFTDDAEAPATQESIDEVEQLWQSKKQFKSIGLKTLYSKD